MSAITKVFISNRAEIVCRIARTAHRLGIRTSGVYTPQDEHTRPVRMLEEAIRIPSGELSANYLNQELMIETALLVKADAVHPGYGFLSENPDFAERVMKAGLIWIGPPPQAMRDLGGKVEAKQVAAKAGVPVTPWRALGPGNLTDSEIDAVVNEIGLPALIKAAHGGGGRGQRVVRQRSEFAEALRSARSEAGRSFGSSEVFVERFLDHPRHIEVQILGDQHGHVFVLGERDCTMQRRNQKVIEEAPAVILDESTRAEMHRAAKALAAAVQYYNAGTIEFLADRKESGAWEFFFMELNARLQVEHPVTEMIFGVDLVELQFRVAQGESLSGIPAQPNGHAIELRLCAEDPSNQFLPSPGPVTEFLSPKDPDVRVESGYEAGDVIPQEYDSLAAKLIVKAPTRSECVSRLRAVLDRTVLAGVLTNQPFLREVLDHPDYVNNDIYTRWIDAHPELTSHSSEELDRDLVFWGKKISSDLFVQRQSFQPLEPLRSDSRWLPQLLRVFEPDPEVHGTVSPQGLIRVAGAFNGNVIVHGWITRFELCLSLQPMVAGIGQRRLFFAGQYEVDDVRAHRGPIIAQVPGLVLDVRAQPEQVVEAHSPLLIVEAMKIEMPVSLPVTAKITMIHVKAGERIIPGQTLVTWEPV